MPTSSYTFGAFQINNEAGGYYLQNKEVNLPVVKPHQTLIARREGMKKSGEQVDARTILVGMRVIGTSRSDLNSKIDALQQALSLRGQTLCIREDGRYYQNVDAIQGPIQLSPGRIVQADLVVSFLCYDPFAYANSTNTYDTGTVALTSSGGTWNFSAISLTGGGTVYSLPFIRIYNRSSTGSTTLTSARNSGTNYTSIAVAATSFSGSTGDSITITHGGVSQTLTASANWSVGATSISVTSFTAGANYVSGDAAAKVTQWTNLLITQSPDSLSLPCSTSTAAPLPSANGDYVDIQCDPSTSNGWTIQTNSSGLLIEPLGLFPVIEPGTTTINISISCASAVSAEASFSWVSRYMS